MLTVPGNAKALLPCAVINQEQDYIAGVTNLGHLLIFPVKDVPILAKGKGNKLINIPGSKGSVREEYLLSVVTLNPQQILLVVCENKTLTLKPNDWQHYLGERGLRGHKLPAQSRRVKKLLVK